MLLLFKFLLLQILCNISPALAAAEFYHRAAARTQAAAPRIRRHTEKSGRIIKAGVALMGLVQSLFQGVSLLSYCAAPSHASLVERAVPRRAGGIVSLINGGGRHHNSHPAEPLGLSI